MLLEFGDQYRLVALSPPDQSVNRTTDPNATRPMEGASFVPTEGHEQAPAQGIETQAPIARAESIREDLFMRSPIISFLATALMLAFLVGCRRSPPSEPVVVGRVIDNFARPVPGATASIRDTAFRAQTDASGNFSLPFSPGAFHLTLEAPGCTKREFDLQVAAPVRHPLGEQLLFRLPETPPAVIAVATVAGYRPLATVTLDREIVLRNGNSYYNRCAEFHLRAPHPVLRGSQFTVFSPAGNLVLVALRGTLVSSDTYLTTTTRCQGAMLAPAQRRDFGNRQLTIFENPPSAAYCFIRFPRPDPDRREAEEANCFRWEQEPGTGANPTMLVPPSGAGPQGQTAGDDHSPSAGEVSAECPERDGKIPCTEMCFREHSRWGYPSNPSVWLAQQQVNGECYAP